jgi:hypothetical protein
MADSERKKQIQNEHKTQKRLFEAGGPPGPGRGKIKDDLDLDIWQATEKIIRKEMNTGTGPEKLKASQLYLKWNELKKVHDKELGQTLPDSAEIKHITQLIATKNLLDIVSTSLNIDFLEAVELMNNHCLDCKMLKAAVKDLNPS